MAGVMILLSLQKMVVLMKNYLEKYVLYLKLPKKKKIGIKLLITYQ